MRVRAADRRAGLGRRGRHAIGAAYRTGRARAGRSRARCRASSAGRASACPNRTIDAFRRRCSTASPIAAWCCSARPRHGTSEFYRARAAITRRLIEQHGFTIVAVEADWPDAARDRPLRRGAGPASRAAAARSRASRPGCGATRDVDAFVDWLRAPQCAATGRAARRLLRARSLQPVRLDRRPCSPISTRSIPSAASVARERYGCLTPWQHDPAVYGRAVLSRRLSAPARTPSWRMLHATCSTSGSTTPREDGERFFDAAQNARLVRGRRALLPHHVLRLAESWNLRDRHMFDTLHVCWSIAAPDAKAVVWAHNSPHRRCALHRHGLARGELNIGQLCRERFGDEAALIGFGTAQRHRRRGVATGTGRWRSRRCARRGQTASSGCSTTARSNAAC